MSKKPGKHPERYEKKDEKDVGSTSTRKERKMTSQEKREEKVKAAQKREEELRKQKQRKENLKRLGIILVCVILVLALGIPTVAISVLGMGGA